MNYKIKLLLTPLIRGECWKIQHGYAPPFIARLLRSPKSSNDIGPGLFQIIDDDDGNDGSWCSLGGFVRDGKYLGIEKDKK